MNAANKMGKAERREERSLQVNFHIHGVITKKIVIKNIQLKNSLLLTAIKFSSYFAL